MELILVLAPYNKISVHTNTPVSKGNKVIHPLSTPNSYSTQTLLYKGSLVVFRKLWVRGLFLGHLPFNNNIICHLITIICHLSVQTHCNNKYSVSGSSSEKYQPFSEFPSSFLFTFFFFLFDLNRSLGFLALNQNIQHQMVLK